MKMIQPTLKELYKEISDTMLKDVEIGDDVYETNHFIYEKKGWQVEGDFDVEGTWIKIGDGWNTPVEFECVKVWGYLGELEVSYYDEDYNDIEVPQEDIDELFDFLKNELERYCRNI